LFLSTPHAFIVFSAYFRPSAAKKKLPAAADETWDPLDSTLVHPESYDIARCPFLNIFALKIAKIWRF
jgi:transcriptional accessory protein Tex/SPT6